MGHVFAKDVLYIVNFKITRKFRDKYYWSSELSLSPLVFREKRPQTHQAARQGTGMAGRGQDGDMDIIWIFFAFVKWAINHGRRAKGVLVTCRQPALAIVPKLAIPGSLRGRLCCVTKIGGKTRLDDAASRD
jgi:hypothetical protein